jgi:hypothetical protein
MGDKQLGLGGSIPEAQTMSVREAEFEKLKAELEEAKARDKELSDLFLKSVTRLGAICSAFGVQADLPPGEFAAAVNARRDEIRRGARP